MIQLKLRTEYAFRRAFGQIPRVLAAVGAAGAAGIADDGTWGYVKWAKACKKAGKKAIFGWEVSVVDDSTAKERQDENVVTLLARNVAGVQQIYRACTEAHRRFYYKPRLDLLTLADFATADVIVLSGTRAPDPEALDRFEHLVIETNPAGGTWNKKAEKIARKLGRPIVACSDVRFPTVADKRAYEVLAGRDKVSATWPQHICSEDELRLAMPDVPDAAYEEAARIADQIEAVSLPKASMLHFVKDETLEQACRRGAKPRKIDLKNKVYAARLKRELDLIAEKGFEDYFWLLSEIVNTARGQMLVGPARGSSAGSLVCYLLGITGVDPIYHDLMFERFVDINRKDLPDIDVDFPDEKREAVLAHAADRYGSKNVARIGTVSEYKPKSVLTDVGKELNIPAYELTDLKGAIIERSGGDARAAFCLADTFESLEVGQKVIAKYPELRIAEELEGHARHPGVHAAGLIVLGEPVSDFASVDRYGTAQVDKGDAEDLNILKVDALGLRTLSVLEDALTQIGKGNEYLEDAPLDDATAYKVIADGRFAGIFQFEGFALQSLAKQMPVVSFEDVVALTTLARPGPLHSGGATEFIKRRTGETKVTYLHKLAEPFTKDSLGVVIYQEQVMAAGRAVGKLSWEDVSSLRKAMSKSLGEEFFNAYWVKFRDGAKENGIPEDEARSIWEKMVTFGCVSGDAIIEFPTSNQHSPRQLTLRELYKRGGYQQPTDSGNRSAQERRGKAKVWSRIGLRAVPERIKNVIYSGQKTTLLVKLTDHKETRTTTNHLWLTPTGWRPLAELRIGSEVAILGPKVEPKDFKGTGSGAHNDSDDHSQKFLRQVVKLRLRFKFCQVCKKKPYQETHHADGDRHNNDPSNLVPICRSCHKKAHPKPVRYSRGRKIEFVKIASISDARIEDVYDIEMLHNENFVADGVVLHNSWAFNKSHAVSYGLISYWCALMKARHPLEFAAACLRHAKDEEQTIKVLRDLVNEGFGYVAFDRQRSGMRWEVVDGRLVGPITGAKGIGPKMGEDIIRRRSAELKLTPHQEKLLAKPDVAYADVFECEHLFHEIYNDPKAHNITSGPVLRCREIDDKDSVVIFIGKLKEKNLRDLNEYGNLVKRGGKKIERNSLFLNLIFEDDTDTIHAKVGRFNYQKLGKPMVETAKIGEWFLVKGKIRRGWRQVQIDIIRPLKGWLEKQAKTTT